MTKAMTDINVFANEAPNAWLYCDFLTDTQSSREDGDLKNSVRSIRRCKPAKKDDSTCNAIGYRAKVVQ